MQHTGNFQVDQAKPAQFCIFTCVERVDDFSGRRGNRIRSRRGRTALPTRVDRFERVAGVFAAELKRRGMQLENVEGLWLTRSDARGASSALKPRVIALSILGLAFTVPRIPRGTASGMGGKPL